MPGKHAYTYTHTQIFILIECCIILLLHEGLQVGVVIGYPFLTLLGSHDLMVFICAHRKQGTHGVIGTPQGL